MQASKQYQAVLRAPFGVLGIVCTNDALAGIDFLPPVALLQAPVNELAREVCMQLESYFVDSNFLFRLPISLQATTHQRRVWRAICAIPRGQTRQYGELARELTSSAQAVGQACGANPVPLVIPCHRVVSKSGLGGFSNQREGLELEIKHWLLTHERRRDF